MFKVVLIICQLQASYCGRMSYELQDTRSIQDCMNSIVAVTAQLKQTMPGWAVASYDCVREEKV